MRVAIMVNMASARYIESSSIRSTDAIGSLRGKPESHIGPASPYSKSTLLSITKEKLAMDHRFGFLSLWKINARDGMIGHDPSEDYHVRSS